MSIWIVHLPCYRVLSAPASEQGSEALNRRKEKGEEEEKGHEEKRNAQSVVNNTVIPAPLRHV